MLSFSARHALGAGLACILIVASSVPAAFARGAPESFADLAEQTLPAVVNISTTQTVERGAGPARPQFPPGSPFEEFFKDFFDRQQPNNNGKQAPRKATSLGSGFVIDASGIIVTNNHVIADADEIVVRFQDETTLPATLLGRDEKTDVAILKVESPTPLVALAVGDSRRARVGDWVIAIGNPFGLGGSVTAGIISARQRDINSGPYDAFIQTDAAINKGNSGGPLINALGEQIGVVTSKQGGADGIAFAIAADRVRALLPGALAPEARRGFWLGVEVDPLAPEARVVAVAEGSPAAAAGVRSGDVLRRVGALPVTDGAVFQLAHADLADIHRCDVGDAVGHQRPAGRIDRVGER